MEDISAHSLQHNIITAQRNSMFPETVQALSIVLEGFKNKLLKQTVHVQIICMALDLI